MHQQQLYFPTQKIKVIELKNQKNNLFRTKSTHYACLNSPNLNANLDNYPYCKYKNNFHNDTVRYDMIRKRYDFIRKWFDVISFLVFCSL